MRAKLIGAFVVLVAVFPALGIAGASLDAGTSHQTEETNESLSPGEQFAGIVSVQQAELGGELAERSFGLQLAAANDTDKAAAVVEAQFTDTNERLVALEQRLQQLSERRDAGEIGPGRYAAEAARIDAERRSLARLANYTARAAAELPADVREQRGVNLTAIQTLSERASELGGEEISDIARSIAGPRVGQSIAEQRGQGPPAGIPGGPPGNDSRPGGPPADDPGSDTPPGSADDRSDTRDEQDAPGEETGMGPADSDGVADRNDTSSDAPPGNETDDPGSAGETGSDSGSDSGSADEPDGSPTELRPTVGR